MQKTKVDVNRSMTVLTRHMHDGKVWFIQGEMAEDLEPMDRLGRLDARLVRDMSVRGLVSFGTPAEATVGVFCGSKETRETEAYF